MKSFRTLVGVVGLMLLCCSGSLAASQAEKLRAVDYALAGPLVSVLSEQLGGQAVVVRLEKMNVELSGSNLHTVTGFGTLCIEGQNEWMGFRYQAVYDSRLEQAGFPQVSIGGVTENERDVPNDPRLVRLLDEQVSLILAAEKNLPLVRLQLDRITTVEAGTRYLSMNAGGLADLGVAGTLALSIDGIFDRSRNEWLSVHYDLGDSSASRVSLTGAE